MPQSFLDQAGVSFDDITGEPGFSGSHDATIELVEAGTFEVGALNSQVWDARVAAGQVDLTRVREIFRTPPYYDYHWVLHPDASSRLGDELEQQVVDALLALDPQDPEALAILELFGAKAFIPTEDANYAEIEKVGRDIGKIVD